MTIVSILIGTFLAMVIMGSGSLRIDTTLSVLIVLIVPIITGYFVDYDEKKATKGLIASSIYEAKLMFKGSAPNNKPGEKIEVNFKIKDKNSSKVYFSKDDMERMSAELGDLVYVCDKRKWLGGLKSIHSVYGKPHNDNGVVYINQSQSETGLFSAGYTLIAEKEM